MVKKVNDLKELFLKENKGVGFVGRNLWERYEEVVGELCIVKSSKFLCSLIDLDI